MPEGAKALPEKRAGRFCLCAHFFVLFKCAKSSLYHRTADDSFVEEQFGPSRQQRLRPTLGCAFFLFALHTISVAQTFDTLRIATYNLLNYPGSTSAVRNPEYRKVLSNVNPDVLVVQEMTSATGMTQFKSQVLNNSLPDTFSAIPFNDGPDTDNGLFFKASKVEYIGATYLPTSLRDIAIYTLKPSNSPDTLRICSLHLKASQGSANEQQRLAEATTLRNYLNSLPTGSEFIVAGDFNIYVSSEPAFQKLTGNETNNNGRAKDPLDLVGPWHDDFTFAPYHTQSPRMRQFDGGATGGMDDRFDMLLISYSMDDNILVSTYTAYGNDGNHFNDSINRLPNGAVPDSIAKALHNASDHLPVFADFIFPTSSASAPSAFTDSAVSVSASGSVILGTVNPNASATGAAFEWGTTTAYGNSTGIQNLGSGTIPIQISASISGLSAGTEYHFRVVASNSGGTSMGTDAMFATNESITIQDSVSQGWNMVSLPVTAGNPSKASVFPTATSVAFAYQSGSGYVQRDTLQNGPGYWLKFSSPQTITITGGVRNSDSISLQAGWNMVGSISAKIPVGSITTQPSGILNTGFFGYQAGYVLSDTLFPGRGYWVKASTQGTMYLSP